MSVRPPLPTRRSTPEFVRWALERPCRLRGGRDWTDPERTERQLRSLRAYDLAVVENRVFEGVCVEDAGDRTPQFGFLEDEVLEAYGGRREIESACSACPANVAQPPKWNAHAGCHDMLIKTDVEPFVDRLDEAPRHGSTGDRFRSLFPVTDPPWYGIWMNPLPTLEQRRFLAELFESLAASVRAPESSVSALCRALRASCEHGLPLHWRLEPEGRIEGSAWIVAEHCRDCKAPGSRSHPSSGGRPCRVCGRSTRPMPSRRRNVRGNRPYWRLDRFLGEIGAAEFVDRYLRRHETPPPEEDGVTESSRRSC